MAARHTLEHHRGSSSWRRAGRPLKKLLALRGMPVVDLSSARRVGYVMNAEIDPADSRIQSLDVGATGDSAHRRIPGIDVRHLGEDAVVVLPSTFASTSVNPLDGDPDIDMDIMVGLEVLADDGNRVGYITDAYIHPETLAIQAYELWTPFWSRLFRGPNVIAPNELVRCSSDFMIIRSGEGAEQMEMDTARIDTSATGWHRPVDDSIRVEDYHRGDDRIQRSA